VICGETDIDVRKAHPDVPIAEVFLQPDAGANPPVLDAIAAADLIVLGPGDLYTSVIPNLLVHDISAAISAASATRVYVCNVMTKHGETDGFSASSFIREINHYLGGEGRLDCAVLNYHESIPRPLSAKYKAARAVPVAIDLAACYECVPHLVVKPLTRTGVFLRHDPDLLAETLIDLVAPGDGGRGHAGVPLTAG
jgi:uncharacterized cofD-like protein